MTDANKSDIRPRTRRGLPSTLPATGYLRLRQILGDASTDPPTPAIYPVSRSTWWAGVKTGRFPAPERLGPNTVAWRVEAIRELVERERAA